MAQVPFDRLLNSAKIAEYVTDKRLSAKSYMRYMVIRLQKMFKYENLPESIPHEMLEYYLLMNGSCFITKVEDKLYAFVGGFGGEPDVYYRPTRYTIANPALRYSSYNEISTDAPPAGTEFTYKVGEDGVLVRNDSLWVGLAPLMSRYSTLMAENAVTVRSADIMLRVIALLTAPDDATKIAAEAYLKKMEKGELGVIAENRFFDGVKMQSPPSNNGSYLTQFIELQQYLKGSFYNEIGLNANFNMKREAIGKGESSLNEDSLLPLCEDMLKCRKEDMKRVSDLFGIDPPISVDFDSAWQMNLEQMESELAGIKYDAELQKQQVEHLKETISRLTENGSSDEEGAVDEGIEEVSQLTEENNEEGDESYESSVNESENDDSNE